MANFEPRWDLVAGTNNIIEGQETYFRVVISKKIPSEVSNNYDLTENQYLQMVVEITSIGDEFEERDYVITCGESTQDLKPISIEQTGNPNILGTHVIKLEKKDYELIGTEEDVYFFKITRPNNGVWDNPSTIQFELKQIHLFTIEDDQIAEEVESGTLGTTIQTLEYSALWEVWVTPDLIVFEKELFAIGEISYGAESRLFMQAFGQSKVINGVKNVFVPAYELLPLTDADLPAENKTSKATYMVPDYSAGLKQKEVPLLLKDELGDMIDPGLRFDTNNGQFVSMCLYDSDPTDVYVKAKVVSVRSQYTTPEDGYYLNKRFRAYETWVCPPSPDYHGDAKPGHLYQLKDTTVYPYVVREETIQSETKLVFDESAWFDMGLYNESLGATVIGNTRMFRIVMNDSSSSDISFETDEDLGQIHVGEYFGHSVYPKIKASGSNWITYTIDHESSPNDILRYGLDLTADGLMVGTAYATSSDFSSNDDIKLEFDIIATSKEGKSAKSRFKIKIVRGFGENYLTAMANPSLTFERAWFKMISTTIFGTIPFYRASDSRYGLQKVPRILLKENYLDPLRPYLGFKETKKLILDNIINTNTGAPEPTGAFRVTLGNYKVRSAVDNFGNVLYDVLYREIHPQGSLVPISDKPYEYTSMTESVIGELYGLRQNIFTTIGEDTQNLIKDPIDLRNRSITVDAISGLSDEMLDTVPRYMNHPYIQTANTVKAQYLTAIPVAYLPPSTGEGFFNTLVQSNEHGTLLNVEFDISSVEFLFWASDNERHVQSNFVAPLRMPLLSQ